jgi:ABC-type branched-subunit amino acid transport system permease subunit
MTFAAAGAAAFGQSVEKGLPWLPAVVLAGLVAAAIGAVVAIPAIRLSGVYLAIATFGFALLVQNLFFPASFVFGSYSRVLLAPRPSLGFLDLQSDTAYYYVTLAVTLVVCGAVLAVRRGRLGRLLQGLADAPPALDAHGVNTNVTRLWVFCLSAALAGIAGAVITPVTGSITSAPFSYSVSLLLVAVLFIAGRQPIAGAFVAAALYVVVPSYISSPTVLSYTPVAFGAGALLAAMAGGLPIVDRLRGSKRAAERVGRSPVRRRMVVAS